MRIHLNPAPVSMHQLQRGLISLTIQCRGKADDMQGAAQPILQGLHDLVIVLSIVLGAVLAGTVGYFIYASNMKLEP